jgi:hypothetical protein
MVDEATGSRVGTPQHCGAPIIAANGSAPRVSRPRSAERSEGSLVHAQAIPENAVNGAPYRCARSRAGASVVMMWPPERARQRFPRVHSALRGVDPRARSAEEYATIEAPDGCQHGMTDA